MGPATPTTAAVERLVPLTAQSGTTTGATTTAAGSGGGEPLAILIFPVIVILLVGGAFLYFGPGLGEDAEESADDPED